MLSLSPAVRIFVATTPTNMHLSFDRLAALARDVIRECGRRPIVNAQIGRT